MLRDVLGREMRNFPERTDCARFMEDVGCSKRAKGTFAQGSEHNGPADGSEHAADRNDHCQHLRNKRGHLPSMEGRRPLLE